MRYSNVFKPTMLSAVIALTLSSGAYAEDDGMEHLSIFGSSTAVNDIPGSAHQLTKDDLAKFDYSDIMRTLTTIPGVYVLEEDGYGLRPNIGMRGTGQSRSEKITIMEDGVLIAPAPYAAPSAYYFPTFGRMEQVEVLKGTSSALYGPRTTGGVINLLSRQIPDSELAGRVSLAAGQDGYAKLHGYVGGQGERIGSVFEVYRYQADGFKHINHSNKDTGFVKNDFLAKVRINSDKQAKYYQELEFKLQYSDEDSNETYMGVTAADFKLDPYQRYSASELDNMKTEHKQLQINHYIELSERFSLGSTAYYNNFHRNWYKTSKINGKSLSSGIADAASFDVDPSSLADGILSFDVKANNRSYISKGIQTTLDIDLDEHQVKLGARYHYDEMDRFQWVDKYQLNSSYDVALRENGAGVPGTDSNRIDSAKALALFVQDQYMIGDFIITAGLRYEDMTIERDDWKKADPLRTATPTVQKSNKVSAWLPSLAATYKVNESLVIVGGVQKGFAPPSPGNDKAEVEESVNYEFGTRFNQENTRFEAIAFYSDYSNMHGNCTAAQGCDDANIGDQYNAGKVEIKGLELAAGYTVDFSGISMPIDLTYTYTDSKFKNSFESGLDTWGDVKAGDSLPYLAENQWQLGVGLEAEQWRGYVAVRYLGDMRIQAGQGTIPTDELIEARTIVDLSTSYDVAQNQQVTFRIDNLFDKEYATNRVYGSLMVGKPRTASIGYKYNF